MTLTIDANDLLRLKTYLCAMESRSGFYIQLLNEKSLPLMGERFYKNLRFNPFLFNFCQSES